MRFGTVAHLSECSLSAVRLVGWIGHSTARICRRPGKRRRLDSAGQETSLLNLPNCLASGPP